MSQEKLPDQAGKQTSTDTRHRWPGRLNRILVAVGVIAFGLIIVDRIASIYRTEDASRVTAAKAVNEDQTASDTEASSANTPVNTESTPIERTRSTDPGSAFGARVVMVSAADPKFVITETDQRFVIGDEIHEGTGTVLQDINDQAIVLRSGDESITSIDISDLATQ